MQIEEVALTAIKPYWRNPRDNDGGVEAVKKSIQDYGFNSPIVVDTEYVIINGHTRYKALQQLGYDKVQIIVVDLPAQKVKQYRIADNKTSELSEWDYPKLILELKELADLPVMQDYFPDLDLSSIVNTLPKSVSHDITDEEVTKVSDLLGKNYTTRNEEERKGFIPLICPDCGYEYSLHIHALQRMIDGIKKIVEYDANTEALS
jgi:hypothetical protein